MFKLLIYPYPNNKYVKEISEALLNEIFENLDSSIWVKHSNMLSSAKRNYSKDYKPALAVDFLMPKIVKKMQTGRKSDPNILRELYFDINNKTIGRQYSFTGCLYEPKITNELLEFLSYEESYKEIYEYMHSLKIM